MGYKIMKTIRAERNCVLQIVKFDDESLACMKTLTTESFNGMTKLIREVINLALVNNEELSLKYLDSQITLVSGTYNVRIFTEYCEGGDLSNCLHYRSIDNKFYDDSEIIEIMTKFIGYFSRLQQRNICHRDIKPENIFIKNGKLKIGDFGSSLLVENTNEHTIMGSPYYLSPELREAWNDYIMRIGGRKAVYLPQKSDVYSLGLVFLYISTLQRIDHKFEDLFQLKDLILSRTSVIRNVKIRKIIEIMLEIHPSQRPDFIELEAIVVKFFADSACLVCFEKCLSQEVICKTCDSVYHTQCIKDSMCKNCNTSLQKCQMCHGNIEKLENCGHPLCENCRKRNFQCQFCVLFKINEDIVCEAQFINLKSIRCLNCKNNAILSPNRAEFVCPFCNSKFCAICKAEPHENSSCLVDHEIIEIKCNCGNRSQCFKSELFFLCSNCSFICRVCLESIHKNHIECSYLIQNYIKN